MPDIIKVAEATGGRNSFEFPMVDSAGNKLTGLTVTGRIIKDGTDGVAGGTFAEKDATNWPGLYTYVPSTAERATAGACLLAPVATGALSAYYKFQVIGNDVYAVSASTTDISTAVWAAGTRSLTTFGTLAADAATAVWAAGSRTLTGFGTLVADIWAYATRALTDKAGFGLSSTERTAIRTEMEGAGTKLSTTATAAATIQAKTDNLPSDLGTTLAGMPAAILDLASAIDGYTPRQVLGIMLAILRGKVSGMESNSPRFRDSLDTVDRVIAVTDDNDNRITVVVDLTGL